MSAILIDPNPDTVLERALRGRWPDVRTFSNADDAWRELQRDEVELIVLSLIDEETLDLCRRVRHTPEGEYITILAVMAEYSPEKLEAILTADVDEYIIESLDRPERLDARLAFAQKNVSGKQQRYRADREIRARLRQRATLAAIGERALGEQNLDSLLEAVVSTVADAMDVDFVRILMADESGDHLRHVAGVGWDTISQDDYVVSAEPDTHIAFAFRRREPVLIDDLSKESRFKVPELVLRHGVRSGAIVPIGSTRPFGLLAAHTRERRAFNQDDIYFLQAVSNIISSFVERWRIQEALSESEARARAILDTTVDGIITIDERGTIESFNPAAERLFRYAADEVIGKNVRELMPEPYASEHDDYLDNYLRTGVKRIIGIGREVVGKRKDGTTFPMYLAVSELHYEGRRLFTGIVRDVTEPRRLEQEILRISDDERRRIGQDLHDGLGQMLTGIGLICRNLTARLKTEKHPVGDDLQEVTSLVQEADQFARNLARGLIPVEVEAEGLSAALRRLTGNAERLFGVRCTYTDSKRTSLRDDAAAMHLYRIAQEALSNAAKHGRASKIHVQLHGDERHLRLRVEDDGIGFVRKREEDRGMGIRIMHYRSRLIGGALDISAGPEGGTVVTCIIPLQRLNHANHTNGQEQNEP